MDIVLVECPGDRRVLLCGRSLVYAEEPDCRHPHHDAEWMAEQLARAAGVGVSVHPVQLPQDFAVRDEDGPLPDFSPEHVRDWWVSMCDSQAEDAAMTTQPNYPTLAEQILGVIWHAGLEATDEVRRLAAELERAALEGGCSGD